MASSTISPARSGVAPTSTPQVDWSDPLNRGLAALCAATTGNLLRDIAFGNDAALTASPPWVSAQPRLRTGISFNGSTQLATVPNNARLNTVTAAVTVAVWTNVLSGEGGSSNRVVCRTGPSTTPVYDLYVSGTNTLGSRLTNSSGTSNFNQVTIPSIASSWHLIGMDYDGVSASHAWLDGVSYSLGSIITGALVSSTNTLTIGKGQQGSNYLGIVAQVRIWNRVLAPGEWARLADYPFAGIEAPRRRLYFGASGGGVTTINLGKGAYSYSGVKVEIPRLIQLGKGTYSYSGKSSPLSKTINLGKGTYSYAGKASPLSVSISLKKGTYSYAGLPVGAGIVINLSKGTYSYTGKPVTLPLIINLKKGTYSYSGKSSPPAISIALRKGTYSYYGVAVQIPGVETADNLISFKPSRWHYH